MLGIAKNFRSVHGDAKFATLARVVFSDADADASGSIDAQEVRALLKRLGIVLTADQAKEVLAHYDLDHNGTLGETEWLGLVSDLADGTFEEANKLGATGTVPAGPAIALRKAAKPPPLTKGEVEALTPAELAAYLRVPGNAARLVEAVEAAGLSGSALAERLALVTGPPPKVPVGGALAAGVEDARAALTAQYAAWGRPRQGPTFKNWGSDEPLGKWGSLMLDAAGFVVKLRGVNGVDLVSSPLLPAMGALTRLQEIQIFGSRLRGGLEALTKCSGLKHIHMSSNELEGTLEPLGLLTNLEYIKVNDNDFVGTLDCLATCKALKTLIVSGCEISGGLDFAESCTQLETLDVGANQLACSLEPLAACTKLEIFYANNNQQLSSTLDEIHHLEPSIKKIDLQGTNVKATQKDFQVFGQRLLCAARPWEAPTEEEPPQLERAASSIQAAVRGKAARKEVKKAKDDKAAASVIQAKARGRAVRKKSGK